MGLLFIIPLVVSGTVGLILDLKGHNNPVHYWVLGAIGGAVAGAIQTTFLN